MKLLIGTSLQYILVADVRQQPPAAKWKRSVAVSLRPEGALSEEFARGRAVLLELNTIKSDNCEDEGGGEKMSPR